MTRAGHVQSPEYEHGTIPQEATRLTSDNRFVIGGVNYWRNMGANPVGELVIGPLYDEMVALSDGRAVDFDLRTDFYDDLPAYREKRTLSGTMMSRLPQDIPDSIRQVHTDMIGLVSDLPLLSVDTSVDLHPMIREHRNMQAHIDTPRRATSNPAIGKISLITAVPDPTEFLVDGHEFVGPEEAIFDVDGSLIDEAGLAKKFISFEAGTIVIFGASTTVHAEKRHSPEDVYKRTPRLLIRSLIEYSK